MRYIIGDIHGCYHEYQRMLEKIRFSEEDELYILGDAMDRGPEPIRVMQDIMSRPNVIYILGNHDIAFCLVMKTLAVEITEENVETQLDSDIFIKHADWIADGGTVTQTQFRRLSREEQIDLMDYLKEESVFYEIIDTEEKQYILVHGGLGDAEYFSENRDLNDLHPADFAEVRMDYGKRYFSDPNTFVVSGHTPTDLIPGWNKIEVYQKNGHIALDTGCVNTGVLACYCVETEEVFYVGKE